MLRYQIVFISEEKKMLKLTPPMGWNSWNTFGPNINEQVVRESAKAIVDNGLNKLGYEYVVIDDCWSLKQRDENGRLVADPEKFPSGMKAVADYVHSLGLKFGMYSCAGTVTCAGYPASFDYEFIDARTFAEWGVDFLKYDYCYHPVAVSGKLSYRKMGAALANCGREILFSACSWGADNTHAWIRSTGASMWRSTGDIHDNFNSIRDIILQMLDVKNNYNTDFNGAMPFGGIGCFNDMDMLVVGMNGKGNVGLGGCTYEEYKTHFSAWALFGSPLMLGSDVRDIDEQTKSIITNREVIAINQDRLCAQPYLGYVRWLDETPCNAIVKPLENGDFAVLLINLFDHERLITFAGEQIGITPSTGVKLHATDLWTGEQFEIHNHIMLENLQPHCCRFLRVKLVQD